MSPKAPLLSYAHQLHADDQVHKTPVHMLAQVISSHKQHHSQSYTLIDDVSPHQPILETTIRHIRVFRIMLLLLILLTMRQMEKMPNTMSPLLFMLLILALSPLHLLRLLIRLLLPMTPFQHDELPQFNDSLPTYTGFDDVARFFERAFDCVDDDGAAFVGVPVPYVQAVAVVVRFLGAAHGLAKDIFVELLHVGLIAADGDDIPRFLAAFCACEKRGGEERLAGRRAAEHHVGGSDVLLKQPTVLGVYGGEDTGPEFRG